jgi:hypothetical protein
MGIRQSVPTNRPLLIQAQSIVFAPRRDRTVLYHGDEGARRAELFVRQHPGYTRIDELLEGSPPKGNPEGRELLRLLKAKPWAQKEEVWWELSRKLARAASGDVHCFGPERLTRSQPVSTHRSRFAPRAYANTVFEKVELPELDNNHLVETIYYNGTPLR